MTVVLASVAYWAPVTLNLSGDDGKPEVVAFRARFKRLKTSERKQLGEDLNSKVLTDEQFLDRLLLDWDLKDKTGSFVVYSSQVRAELVEDWDGLELALVTAWFENNRKSTETAAVAKNSGAPSATTSTLTAPTAS